MGGVPVGDDLVLDRLLLGRLAAAEAAVPAELDRRAGCGARRRLAGGRGRPLAPPASPVDGTGVPVDDPPQALTTSAAIARIVPERVSRGAMQLLLLGPWLGQPDVAPAVGRRRCRVVVRGRCGAAVPVSAAGCAPGPVSSVCQLERTTIRSM